LQNQRFGDQPYRLSEQGKESSQFEIHDGDIIQLGEEFVTNGVTHNAIKIHIKLPTQSPQGTNLSTEEFDSNFVYVPFRFFFVFFCISFRRTNLWPQRLHCRS